LSDVIDKRLEEERMVADPLEDELRDDETIAPRPRGRLLRPLPLVLMALTIAAAGFLGGVVAQQGSEGGSATGGAAGGFAALAAKREGTSATPSGGGSTAATTGTVTAVDGHTIYVKEAGGTVVAVKAGDGSTVSRDSDVSVKKVHPGDTVVVEGAKHGSTVKASSIAATEAGVGPTAAPGAAGTSVESLFGG
jgi:endonuclease YncB( thermonuclease family)